LDDSQKDYFNAQIAARGIAAAKSEARNPKSETNSNNQNSKMT